VWGPKKYAGTYGTNGFYLNFSDNSAATAAAIGKDSSGNGNNWTPNNISVTAGVTYDSMIDTPTPYADGGNGRGNYCVLNPLLASASLSAGNLDFSQTNTKTAATFGVTSGKWYAEAKVNTVANQLFILGVAKVGDGSSYNMFASGVGYYANDGTKYVDGTNTSYGATYTAGDTIGIALDMDGGTVTFYKNNTSQGSITLPASSQGYFPLAIQASSGSTSATWSVNFGQRPFTYTPPTGFVALNTQNLPAPTIKAGNKYFDATTYTGNGTSQSIVNSGAFQPDLVWYKSRSAVTDHRLFDSVRGIANALYSDTTSAETAEATAITSLNSNGFSLGAGSGNTNTQTYVGWQWKKGATPGFDIVTYTGTGSTRTVAHSLGVAPSMIIIKNRSVGTDDWPVYHVSVGAASRLYLDTTGASTSDPTGFMNSTAPTSSVFTVGSNSSVNNSGSNLVAYCFAEVAGFSKFGKYTGNGSTDGPFVYCGFRPRFVMIKETTANGTGAWVILDSSRDTYNQTTNALFANSSAAESTTFYTDFLSNGFKLRVGSGSVMNFNSSSTYIYAAFAENPFRLALAR
jgi:hypothetical protein